MTKEKTKEKEMEVKKESSLRNEKVFAKTMQSNKK